MRKVARLSVFAVVAVVSQLQLRGQSAAPGKTEVRIDP